MCYLRHTVEVIEGRVYIFYKIRMKLLPRNAKG
ncbi:hypothetical protein FHX34_10171 [Actinoplanes teichomyceticus]|uniref:Uncharacterized protein n=1 Tax=Actinoplanes teichomyceticus TaxID=1867 RepID=A0A561WMM6_ACTTI|nr:hypothetical protein FHX34_10171 [Actinoplanes teichomyceticus]